MHQIRPTYEQQEAAALFIREDNRLKEERFARRFTGKDNVNLAFIHENQAFTDGRNITVDPMEDELYADTIALENTAGLLEIDKRVCEPWNALYFTARAQEIHECLHIIYTRFPMMSLTDERSTNDARFAVLAMIANIIEDSYIENVGASESPETEIFLRWGRASRMFVSHPSEGTITRRFAKAGIDTGTAFTDGERLSYILDHITFMLLYPMFESAPPRDDCKELIEKCAPLFFKGSECGKPAERQLYADIIFDILEPLIPDEKPDLSSTEGLLGGTGTHRNGGSLTNTQSEGKEGTVTRRLFTGLNGDPIKTDTEQAQTIIIESSAEYEELEKDEQNGANVVIVQGSSTGAAVMHNNIRIKVTSPRPDKRLEKSYNDIRSRHIVQINKYKRRFSQLIVAENEFRDEKKLFGSGISSKNFADTKKRYWYVKHYEQGTPEMSFLIMLDGSGSMWGARRNAVIQSTIILHEVLQSQGIAHAVVEHRAIYDEPLVEHNILIGFNGSSTQKYNLMTFTADEGTREGLSLYWAENYINMNSATENKMIIAISDGLPAHYDGNLDYYPPVSTMDTKNAAEKIIHRGTPIIAVALGDCYKELSSVYPRVVACDDLTTLTGQLVKIIAEEFAARR